jgi:hypothetical protein
MESFYLISLGMLVSVGILFTALAMQHEEAGVISLIRTSDVIFAFFWQFVLMNVLPDMFRYFILIIIMFKLF